ncbi:MAG: dethiobiotin synthase [Chitinophagaceae bacterium]
MLQPIFITGIGTGVGKTIISAIITEALKANYWKPIQAGFDDGTDALEVKQLVSNTDSLFFDEVYKLKLPASPHIAAREENIKIEMNDIVSSYQNISKNNANNNLIIEGAGGLLVPINDNEFIIDIIKNLNAKVILVSRNYLGSINHSLLTAQICKQQNIDVLGWVFNDQFMQYEDEIVHWSGYTKISSVPLATTLSASWVSQQAKILEGSLRKVLGY